MKKIIIGLACLVLVVGGFFAYAVYKTNEQNQAWNNLHQAAGKAIAESSIALSQADQYGGISVGSSATGGAVVPPPAAVTQTQTTGNPQSSCTTIASKITAQDQARNAAQTRPRFVIKLLGSHYNVALSACVYEQSLTLAPGITTTPDDADDGVRSLRKIPYSDFKGALDQTYASTAVASCTDVGSNYPRPSPVCLNADWKTISAAQFESIVTQYMTQ